MTLERQGAARLDRAALSILDELHAVARGSPDMRPGTRLRSDGPLQRLLAPEAPLGAVAAARLGPAARPVRAILFDKTVEMNWSLAWHQDRTIVVRQRRETAGFGPWTVKAGMIHVAPPPALLAGMLTMRVHLDDVPEGNAPLLVAPGSHRFGRIAEDRIERVVRRLGTTTCLAEAGDIWLYATPILHAPTPARPSRAAAGFCRSISPPRICVAA